MNPVAQVPATDRFRQCLEGVTWNPNFDGQGLHNTLGDRGGATSWGVTIGTYTAWRLLHGIPVTTVADLGRATKDELAQLIRVMFWNPVQGDQLWPGLDLLVYDFAYGSGPVPSGRVLQQLLGFTGRDVDGQIGPKTLRAAAGVNDRRQFVDSLAASHLRFYQGIRSDAAGRGGWLQFGRGWQNRNTFRWKLAQVLVRATD